MEAASSLEDGLSCAKAIRQGQDHLKTDDRTARNRIAADRHLVERGLTADPTAGAGHEMALGHDRGIERPMESDNHRVVWLGQGGRVSELDPGHVAIGDQALSAQEADRQLRFGAGRAHRDRDRNRVLAWAGDPNLHRLLADEGVATLFDDGPADRQDPSARDVAGGISHGRSLPAQSRGLDTGPPARIEAEQGP